MATESSSDAGSPSATGGESSDNTNAAGRAQMQNLVVGRLNEHGHPIRSRDLHRKLVDEGHSGLTPDSVSNALWYAAERLRTVRKLDRGIYAPLAWSDSTEAPPTADPVVTGDRDLLDHAGLNPPALTVRAACELLDI
jgi:hypothetical protein